MEESLVEAIVISDEELKSLTDAINQRHGIDFGCYEMKSLKRRVIRAMNVFKFTSIHELWMKILKEREFIYSFMDEISVGLTSMFRDPVLWKTLKSTLNGPWAGRSGLSIWHAGCSTGEEVYTMGIVLQESTFRKRVSARATDISKLSIETAKRGKYHSIKYDEYERNLRMYNPLSSLKKYSSSENSWIQMDPALINHVTFEYHNLITDSFVNTYDIIFCRNVMIYFDNGAKKKLFEKFHKSLNKDGLLIIGFYDAVVQLIDHSMFKMIDVDAKIFQKV